MNRLDLEYEVEDLSKKVTGYRKRLRELKLANPKLGRMHYAGDPGSLLNAYALGDVSFEDAVRELKEDAVAQAKQKLVETIVERFVKELI